MPELPEVERAAKLLRELTLGKTVVKVDSVEDAIVFSGATHEQFTQEIQGRRVTDVQRYGKVFYVILDGEGRHPVLHFGMTGMLQVKGQIAMHYRESGVHKKATGEWPPRFMKFVMHIKGDTGEEISEIAFLDARRLARIRLCKSPLTEPPISALGFDPILSMVSLADFKKGLVKRRSPVKAALLDQSFSAGVGNWVADEILYHARVHPEERCDVLTDAQVTALHKQTSEVCITAVSVNADDTKFPEDWLFKHRWPNGELATIKWVTVGGRTSAYVAELQKLRRGSDAPAAKKEDDDNESDLTPLSGEEEVEVKKVTTRKLKRKLNAAEGSTPPTKKTRQRKSRGSHKA